MTIHRRETLVGFLKPIYWAPEKFDSEVFAKFGIEAFVDPFLPDSVVFFPWRDYERRYDPAGNPLLPLIDRTT